MAQTNKLLTTDAPDGRSLSPGTSFTLGHLDPLESRATVTEFVTSGLNGETAYQNEAGAAAARMTFAGIPIRTSTVHGFKNGTGVVIKRYSRRGFRGGLRSRVTVGQTQFSVYFLPDGSINTNAQTGAPTPYFRGSSTLEVVWRIEGNDRLTTPGVAGLIDRINDNVFTVDGLTFTTGSLRFRGVNEVHNAHGAWDEFISDFHASFSPVGWRREVVTDNTTNPVTIGNVDLFQPGGFQNLPTP